jgi:hypothetical protein
MVPWRRDIIAVSTVSQAFVCLAVLYCNHGFVKFDDCIARNDLEDYVFLQ